MNGAINSIDWEKLEAKIIENDSTEIILSHRGNGEFEVHDYLVKEEAAYDLEIDYGDRLMTSNTYVYESPKAKISDDLIYLAKIEAGGIPNFEERSDPIDITWNNTTGEYYYVVIENLESDPEYINEKRAELEGTEGAGRFEITTEPDVMDIYSIDPFREIVYFGTHRIVVYRLNPEYAALYEGNGNSSLNLSQTTGNIDQGAGIFTGVSSDTLYLEVVKD